MKPQLLIVIILSSTLGWSGAVMAQGGIYRCVKKNGEVSFTNVDGEAQGCKRLLVTPKKNAKPDINDKIVEQAFPKVDVFTQKKRDETRDELLRKELDEQKKNLAEIIDKLTHFEITQSEDQQKQIERFKALNEERRVREKSIAELEKQLGL